MKRAILLSLIGFNLLLAQPTIEVYSCYGNADELMVEGRVLTERSFKEPKKEESWFTNLWENLGHLINDEKKNTLITLQIDTMQYHSKTDDEGYFEFDVSKSKKSFHKQQPIQLFLNDSSINTVCLALILKDVPQQGIISDFDDTLIVSDVSSKLKLVNNILLKNYKQREMVFGMLERFKDILSHNDADANIALFIITGSPKQLDKNINDFLDFHHFPPRIVISKKMHGKNSDDLLTQATYKTERIEKLIALYPKIEWTLFGDSGEEDQEVYSMIAQKYPKHIKAIFIRNVESAGTSKKILN